MMALIIGLITGFLICIPIGPLGLGIVNISLTKGRPYAIAMACGGSIMDFTYFLVVLTGLSFFHISDELNQIFKICGTLLIISLGIKDLFFTSEIKNLETKILINKKNLIGHVLLGILIYGSNPTLIFSMTAIATLIKSLNTFESTMAQHLLLSFGVATGSFLWFIFLLGLITKAKSKFSLSMLKKLNQVSGALMIGLGVVMAIRLRS